VTDGDLGPNSFRADIVSRSRRRDVEARERRFTTAVFGLLAYSAFANCTSGLLLLGASPVDAAIGLILGPLYALGAYRAWFKDDTSWWPVAIPAGLTIALLSLAALGGVFRPIPILLNVILLVLVPLRSRAVAATNALTSQAGT
jgi:hypothetical protein